MHQPGKIYSEVKLAQVSGHQYLPDVQVPGKREGLWAQQMCWASSVNNWEALFEKKNTTLQIQKGHSPSQDLERRP